MKKIPTIFQRDWDGDRSRVLDVPTPGCEWVFAGEGIATRKYDGSACLIQDGVLFKRHEVRAGKTRPDGFVQVDDDLETGKVVGWVPVGGGPEDKWHREAASQDLADGTYELVGPKIQGNPERVSRHILVSHAFAETFFFPRTFDGIRDALAGLDIEGLVFHHKDGRMAKIKKRDFGLSR